MQLLEAILLDFGITPERRSKVHFFKLLNSFLIEQLAKSSNAVLVIDEAQNLKNSALETIRMLSNLETEKEKLLQIVLVGQPELRAKLNAPELAQLKQRIGVRFHITALTKNEVREYIQHRLYVAGNRNEILFDDDAVSIIAYLSHGIPRVINILCDKALLLGFAQDTRHISKDIINRSFEELQGNFTHATEGAHEHNI